MLQFRFAALSDTGRVREHNEDAGFASPYLLCVADGVEGRDGNRAECFPQELLGAVPFHRRDY